MIWSTILMYENLGIKNLDFEIVRKMEDISPEQTWMVKKISSKGYKTIFDVCRESYDTLRGHSESYLFLCCFSGSELGCSSGLLMPQKDIQFVYRQLSKMCQVFNKRLMVAMRKPLNSNFCLLSDLVKKEIEKYGGSVVLLERGKEVENIVNGISDIHSG